MTHFPLPDGYCRRVCRPKRSDPRLVNTAATIRFAKAAVKHGVEPCELVKAIKIAIKAECGECTKEQDEILQGIDALRDTWGELWLDLALLVKALLGIDSWEHFDKLSKVKWWEILWSRLKFIWSVKEAADALWDVLDDIRALKKQYNAFEEAAIELIECLNRGKSDA